MKTITKLKRNEIFVFGSNADGNHAGGAAKLAHEKFGAKMGVARGRTGKCYAIDTMSGIDVIKEQIQPFIAVAEVLPLMNFLVTEIGCGIAGYTPAQIAPLFKDAINVKNIILPDSFIEIINKVEIVYGVKAFDKNMKCRGFQYEHGKEYEHDGDVKHCESGFHFCENPLDVFNYYSPSESIFAEVEGSGKISRDTDDTKVAVSKLKIGFEIGLHRLIEKSIKFIFERTTLTKESTNKIEKLQASNSGDSGAASNSGDGGAASNSGYRGAASNSGYRGAVSNSGYSGAASNSGYRGAASNSGYSGAASNSGYSGAASNSGYRGAASNSGERGAASNSGDSGAASNSGYSGAASNSGDSGAASNSGDSGAASNSGERGAASNSGDSGAASNSGESGAASNSGYRGAASNSGYSGAASNSGYSGAASNSGYSGAASNSGESGAASNSGYSGAASNSGESGAASNSGYSGAASNSGYIGAASNSGERGAASNSGDSGAAFTIGNYSTAETNAEKSIAVAVGYMNKAKGNIGSWIVLAERKDDDTIVSVKTVIVDGKKIKADTWYILSKGKFVIYK